MAGMNGGQGLSPVRGENRLLVLDALRGFAILGILAVNVELFRGPGVWTGALGETDPVVPDGVLRFVISLLFEGKFISTLAFLFGLGFALQAARAEARGRSSGRLLARRLGALGLIGACHAVLIWSGDILLTYALLGLLLIPFRLRRPRTLLVWAGAVFFVPGLLLLAAGVLVWLLSQGAPTGGAEIPFLQDLARSAQQAYGSGSYPEMVVQRLRELVILLPLGVFGAGFMIFPMMLVGAAVVRAGWIDDLEAHRVGLRRVALLGLAFGLALNGTYAVTTAADPTGGSGLGVIGLACSFLGAPILALGYAGLAALLVPRFPTAAVTRRLAAVGRMALTNYLLQSIIMTSIFYGLGLYGHVGLAAALALCPVAWTANLVVSPIWLSRFPYGPAEWLWRRLTYGRKDLRIGRP